MEKIKVKDVKTGAIKEVKKSLAGDYVGTGNFVLVDDKKNIENKEVKKATPFSKKED